MNIITYKDSFNANALNLVGGKAYNLWKFNHLKVPKWVVITSEFFKSVYKKEYPIINKYCIENNFEEVEKLILEKEFDSKDISVLDNIINSTFKSKLLAVRSSGIDEDSTSYSFAGIMESYLNVKGKDLIITIKKCFASAFSKRAISYRKTNHIPTTNIEMAVVVQEMISADFSGVMNTINPITNNPDEFLVSVVRGLGESLVSGDTDSVDYYINGKEITCEHISLLPKSTLQKVIKLGYQVLAQSSHFQDIEFCIKGNQVYLLQTRDITPYKDIDIKSPRITLDNSNIIESYEGVVTPLTFSFAEEIYYKLYKQTLEVADVPKRIIANLDSSLAHMIVLNEGKIYYNLNSWYHLNSIFPGKNSLGYMERMMGVKTKTTNTLKVKLSLFNIIRSGTIFIKKIKNMEKLTDKFLETFDRVVTPFIGDDFSTKTSKDVIDIYHKIEEEVLGDYTTTIINDSACMIYYGMLTNKVKKLKINDPDGFISSHISKQGNVASAMSVDAFEQIINEINSHKEIQNDFKLLTPNDLYLKYQDNSTLTPLLDNYLKLYGSRVLNELKLETITFFEDPIMLYQMLKNYICNTEIIIKQPISSSANNKDISNSKSLKYLIKKCKYFIKNRELLRLKRTYLFSVVRKIFLKVGCEFKNLGMIDNVRDIFYLKKQEIFALVENPNYLNNIKEIIIERKALYELNATKEYYERIVFYGDEKLIVQKAVDVQGELKGIPSGAGIYQGYVKYIKDINNILNDQKPLDIIMAYRTDPGWISLFPLCKGLIVERGSILSHSAVVAREMGIPAVVGIPNVTKIIKDNDEVIIDGIKGVVQICEKK